MLERFGIINRARDVANAYMRRPLGVEGVDVSHWQGRVDWELVSGAGVRFAYIRATQGVDIIDRMLEGNARHIDGVMPHGFYHFGTWYNADERRPHVDAVAEAEHFVRSCESARRYPFARGQLPPMLDVELSGRAQKGPRDRWDKKPGDHMSYAAVTDWILSFAERCDELTGRTTGIYTGRYFVLGEPKKQARGIGMGNIPHLDDRPLWLAQYNRGAAPKKPIEGWRTQIWQYTGSGKCPGIKGRVDRNAFLGTRGDFLRLLGYDTLLDFTDEEIAGVV